MRANCWIARHRTATTTARPAGTSSADHDHITNELNRSGSGGGYPGGGNRVAAIRRWRLSRQRRARARSAGAVPWMMWWS
jgi:hypothetical protein